MGLSERTPIGRGVHLRMTAGADWAVSKLGARVPKGSATSASASGFDGQAGEMLARATAELRGVSIGQAATCRVAS